MYNTIEFINLEVKNLIERSNMSSQNINIDIISNKIFTGVFDDMTIYDFYTLFVNVCDDLSSLYLEYSQLGAYVLFSKNEYIIKSINNDLTSFVNKVNYINNNLPDFLNDSYVKFVNANQKILNELQNLVPNIPTYLDLFGYKTLEGSYLIRVNKIVIEQPIDMFLRVAIAIHFSDISKIDIIKSTFLNLYHGYYTHATPTLYNAGTKYEQLSSCYLLGTEDSLEGIFKTVHDSAKISKWSGGIGIHVSNIRAKGSRISKTNGESSGIIPMLKVYNDVARYINQGGRGNKRPGAIAIYLEPWHADVQEFLELKLNTGSDELRARDLFLALWIPDLFMKQLEIDGDWYLMCPSTCPGLPDVYGDEFENLYWNYVSMGNYKEKIKASDLLVKITKSLAESGIPYLLFKDHINNKSNQKNIGTIKSSNLCAEICEVSDHESYAVCNLGSIAVNRFYKNGVYDYNKLLDIAYELTINLNNIIDINYYPTPETFKSNLTTRPIGIGIQGMGDLLLAMRIPYESETALEIEATVMETIYYGGLQASIELSKIHGPYSRFEDSPFCQGKFQFDLGYNFTRNLMWDWNNLSKEMMEYGTRNSLITSLMPTASTSQILGNMECFEPITSNLYSRKTAVGVFKIVNKYLVADLIKLNLWNESMKNKIILANGSIQNIPEISNELKNLYKTVWEIKQKSIIDHALARQPFVDQSQSMNLYFDKIDISKVKNALFYGWKKGIKTGCYYMRSKAASNTSAIVEIAEQIVEPCTMCSA